MTRPRLLVLGGTSRIAGMMRRWDDGAFEITWGARQGRGEAGPDWRQIDARTDPAALSVACAQADIILDLSGPTNNPAQSSAGFEAIADLARAVGHAANGTPLLWMSSAAIYGPRAGAHEGDPLAPVSAYGRAKARGEAVLAGRDRVTVLRLGNVAGADALLSQAQPGRPVQLDQFPDGRTPVRSYIGPKTLVKSLFYLADRALSDDPLPPVLNLAAPGSGVEMAQLLEAARLVWTPKVPPPDAVPVSTLETTAFAAVLPLPLATGTAAGLVAEWRADQARAREARV